MFQIDSLLVRTDVTSIKVIEGCVLCGIGGYLHVFYNGPTVCKTAKVFDGQKIYGIVPNSTSTQLLLFGGNEIAITTFSTNLDDQIEAVASLHCQDWILTAKWIDNYTKIATVLMHNLLMVWTNDFQLIHKVSCEEKCILYSAYLVNSNWNDLIILSGTVFNQILIWWPQKYLNRNNSTVLCRLEGHKGVIFSLDYNKTVGLICSTSDDCSAILWKISKPSLSEELSQKDVQITQQYLLLGHGARLFRCFVLNDCVLTAAQDSLINIWDFNGALLRSVEAHQGGSIWALDYKESSNEVISGGADCGVTLFSLTSNISRTDLRIKPKENIKRIAFLHLNTLVSISETGLLEICRINGPKWVEVYRHSDLANYALLEVCQCRNVVALAGINGSIYIYKYSNSFLNYYTEHMVEDKSRVYSMHWLSCKELLVCGIEGNLHLLQLQYKHLALIKTFSLPKSKERWSTAACAWNNKYIAVGDRKGNIYLYNLNQSHPIQIIRKAHNYLGISNLYFSNNELLSLGRNSIVRKYFFDETSEQLVGASLDKLPFAWLADFYKDNDCILILAFTGDEFVLWDYTNRKILIKFSCGGGHRSWDFIKTDQIKFAYIKEKSVVLMRADWSFLQPKSIVNSFHSSEINSACYLTCKNAILLISGGEDTTIRLSLFNPTTKDFETRNVLKSHLSSIRAIKSLKIDAIESDTSCTEEHLLFSAGGRAQIILWSLEIRVDGNDQIEISCREKCSYYKQLNADDSETRIMDLCVVSVKRRVLLLAACSDGNVQIYLIRKEENDFSIILLGKIFYKLKCILKIAHMNILGEDLMVTLATDGKYVFWNLTQLLREINAVVLDCNGNLLVDFLKQFCLSLCPMHVLQVHQSGINSFSYIEINNGDEYLFISGGDDNAINMHIIRFGVDERGLGLDVLNSYSDVSRHCAQITGVYITKEYFLTTSIDQKLNLFNWSMKGDKFSYSFVQKYNCSVADVHGMLCLEKEGIYSILYGKGVEICIINSLL